MSSESDDDCYGNIAQKLQSMKNKYKEDKIETTNLLIADLKKTDNSWRKNESITSEKDCDLSQNSETAEEFTLDAIIAKNSKKPATRSKRSAAVCDNVLPDPVSKRKRTKKTESTAPTNHKLPGTVQVASETANSSVESVPNNIENDSAVNGNSSVNPAFNRPGRGRGRGRQTPRRGRAVPATIPEFFQPTLDSNATCRPNASRSRGRSRRGRARRSNWASEEYEPAMYDFMAALAASAAMMTGCSTQNHANGPIYSIGNTDEYPDHCDDQPLFSSAPKPQSDVVFVDNETELDENEELSVKVYWQSAEHVKFSIRRFQKLTQIFDHFAKQENVSHDKLFFTYNDKILKSDDTPESINYNIVKFIDGGIINQSVSSIVKKDDKEDGIKLKFQCQNVKKPFEMNVKPDDKMLVIMMKCAEHLEKPLDNLKFYFDGDLVTGKSTAREMDLEGGECIDIGIVS